MDSGTIKWVARDNPIAMSQTYYGVVNDFSDGSEAFTFARIGPDNAVFDDEDDAHDAKEELVDEFGDHFTVMEVTLEAVDQ